MAANRGLTRWLGASWPFLVAVAATIGILSVQPAYQLGVDGEYPFASRALYDDADMAAFALRGLNANLGRHPGPAGPDAPINPGIFVDQLQLQPQPPLQDRFFLEYPHAALFLFRAVMAKVPVEGSWPATVLDCHYANIIFHHPRTADEIAMWTTFRRAARVFVVINILALLALMAVLRRGLGPNGSWSGPVWLLVLPSSLYFVMARFDVLPSLFVVLGLAAAGRRRVGLSGFCLGVATALKLYPLVIAPLIWRHLTRDVRSGALWAGGFILPLAVISGTGAVLDGPSGVLAPYQFQFNRPAEPGWILYGRLLPDFLAESKWGRLAVLASVLGGLFVLRPGDMGSLLRRSAAALIVFANLQVFFSPQWILWFIPLLVPLARRSWVLLGMLAALDLLTYITFPLVFDNMGDPEMIAWREVLIHARGILLDGGILGWLAWEGVKNWVPFRPQKPAEVIEMELRPSEVVGVGEKARPRAALSHTGERREIGPPWAAEHTAG